MERSEHRGVVREQKGSRVILEIPRDGLPLAFRSRSILPAGSAVRVIVEVDRLGRELLPGDEVAVLLEEKKTWGWAVFWTFLFPFFLFLLVYQGFLSLTEDWRATLIGTAVLFLPYYTFLWILRDQWSRVFKFSLK